jgi:hypothetical protein
LLVHVITSVLYVRLGRKLYSCQGFANGKGAMTMMMGIIVLLADVELDKGLHVQ